MRLLTLILSLLCINAFAYTPEAYTPYVVMAEFKGDTDWECEMADNFYFGWDGYVKDNRRAAELYRASAYGHGWPRAQCNVGTCYYYGSGFLCDQQEAVKWWRKSAMQGYWRALYNLGWCYENGNGTYKDNIEAYAYYSISAMLVNRVDMTMPKESRDKIEKKLSPKQIETGIKRIKELLEEIKEVEEDRVPKWWQFWKR